MPDYNQSPEEQSDATGAEGATSWVSTFVPEDSSGTEVVNYYFPVEVIVAGGLSPSDRESIQADIYQDLHDAINRRLI